MSQLFYDQDARDGWSHIFWADSTDDRLWTKDQLNFMDWSIEQFGQPVYSFRPLNESRWGMISGGSNTWVQFLDPKDAMLFKLTWGGA